MIASEGRALVAVVWLWALSARAQEIEDERGELDARLADGATLEAVTRAALERSPALAESTARRRAASERASEADRLPDPEFKYEQWGVPLSKPYALQRSDTLMFGLRQSFPAPGARQARARMAGEEVHIAEHERRATERDLVRRVRQAYFDYYEADRALALHDEHVGVAEQTIAQLRASYEVGRGDQRELLKALVELSRLHTAVAETKRQRDVSRHLLNTLMARAPDAPLGPPALALPSSARDAERAALAADPAKERPEVAAAHSSVRRSQSALEAARHAARRPGFMVGADYWLMPMLDSPHAYGAMVAMSLPWLNPARRAEVRAAEASVRADHHAAAAAEDVARFEQHQAVAGLRAALQSLEILEKHVLPQADKSLQAQRSAFAVGQSDLLGFLEALGSLFQVRLEHSRAVARVMSQLAEVEFASGAHVFDSISSEARP